jgi:uncharacterized protein YlxP (DUF503 family)
VERAKMLKKIIKAHNRPISISSRTQKDSKQNSEIHFSSISKGIWKEEKTLRDFSKYIKRVFSLSPKYFAVADFFYSTSS